MSLPPHTPVLVGIGVIMQREEDHTRALEPMDLMLAAVRAAGEDCGAPELLAEDPAEGRLTINAFIRCKTA